MAEHVTLAPDGDKIKYLRARKNWSQKELADEAGISEKKLRQMERGISTCPKTINTLTAPLSVTFEELLAEPEESQLSWIKQVPAPSANVVTSRSLKDFASIDAIVEYLDDLADRINALKAILLQDIVKGSTILALRLYHDDFENLVHAFYSEQLHELDVIALVLPKSTLTAQAIIASLIRSHRPDSFDDVDNFFTNRLPTLFHFAYIDSGPNEITIQGADYQNDPLIVA